MTQPLKQLTAVIDKELHNRAKARASEAGQKLWEFVAQALERELLRTGPPPTVATAPLASGRREFIGGQVDPELVTWTRHQAATEQIPIWRMIDRALRFERARVEGVLPPPPVLMHDGPFMANVEL